MDTKGKSSRGFNHPIGLKTLTDTNEPLLWLVVFHIKMWILKEKRTKKEK